MVKADENRNLYILVMICADSAGVVASVSAFLDRQNAFIRESAYFSDPSSGRLFMRVVFSIPSIVEITQLNHEFSNVARQFQMTAGIYDARRKKRLLLMVSRHDHCLNDLLYRYRIGDLNVDIPAIASNHPDLEKLARWHDIPFYHLPITQQTKAKQENELIKLILDQKIDLVVLARYMQVLSPDMCEKLQGICINIHHSFLPGFNGANPYSRACERGVKLIGATAHYVTGDLDEGPIIEQAVERIDHTYTPKQLVAVGRDIENKVLARAVRAHIEHRVLPNGLKTVVFH